MYAWFSLTVVSSALEGVTLGLLLPIVATSDSESPLQRMFVSLFDHLDVEYTIVLALGAMTVLYALRTVLVVTQELYVARVVATLMVSIKTRFVDQLLETDYQYFTGRGVGFFTNAATMEFTNLTRAFDHCSRTVVAAGFTVAYAILALCVNPVLAIAFVIFAVPAYFLLRVAFRLVQNVSRQNTDNNALLQSHLVHALNGFKYLRATGSASGISGVLSSAIGSQGNLLFSQRRLGAFARNGLDMLTVLLIVGLLLYYVEIVGAALIEMVFMLIIMRRTLSFAQGTQRAYQEFLDHSGSVRLFEQLADELAENREEFEHGTVAPDFNQPIRLTNVSFGYNGEPNVLEDVTLAILPGQKVAFVGVSGSGKTTLATMLTGILRPTSGTISIGGVPYSCIDQRTLREGIGYVTQDSVMFNDTVRNNVSLWSDGCASDGMVKSASELAHASDFIEALPAGYSTHLGSNGMTISGGQRQRISIARELYKNAKVLIFDEGTSALDSETEAAILENIDRLRDDTTLILIAHRLATVRNSDMIFVLEGGRVVEQGTYEYLYALAGRFTRMVDQQVLGEGITDKG